MKLEPLGRFSAPLGRTELVATTPLGRRIIGPIVEARLEGERIAATQRGTSAADWMIVGPDGTTFIDVRIAMKTDDGAFIYISYRGRADWSDGIMSGPVYSAFAFDTEDERYRWLNSRLAVGKGMVAEGHGAYDLALLS